MKNITLVIKLPDNKIKVVAIPSTSLPELINDIRLYENDIEFVNKFISDKTPKTMVTPSEDGLIVIDMVKYQIVDSQGYTGVFKITPTEIKSSYLGNIVVETSESNAVKRFKTAIESGRLKGFEEWYDSGTQMNKTPIDLGTDDLMTFVESMKTYGQFVFDTYPYKVTTYCETDAEEQHKLFEYLKENGFINKVDTENIWNELLEKLKV